MPCAQSASVPQGIELWSEVPKYSATVASWCTLLFIGNQHDVHIKSPNVIFVDTGKIYGVPSPAQYSPPK